MSSFEAAQALYGEVAEREQGVDALARDLDTRADALERDAPPEQGVIGTTRNDAARLLHAAAQDLRSALGSYNPTMKRLPGGTAGEARLQSSAMWIDPEAIMAQGGSRLIDRDVAEDIGRHETRHQRQSATADAGGVTASGQNFDARELREFDAIAEQRSTDFLSAEYLQIRSRAAAVFSSREDRELIRRGEFRWLEQKHAGTAADGAALAA